MVNELQPKFETVMIIDDNITDLYVCSRMITINNFGEKVLEYSVAHGLFDLQSIQYTNF